MKNQSKKLKKIQPTIIDMNNMSESSEEEPPEIIYVKKKKKKKQRKRVVKYVETSSSEEDYGPGFLPQEQYDSSLNDYYKFV